MDEADKLMKQARDLISRVNFRATKHHYKPHAYVIQDKQPALHDVISRLLKTRFAYRKLFVYKVYTYVDIDEYQYWIIGPVLNRAPIVKEE